MEKEKAVIEIESKTYSCITAFFIGIIFPDFIAFSYKFIYHFIDYLIYHNITVTEYVGVPHYVNLERMKIEGILALVLALIFVVLLKYYINKIKIIEKKKIIISVSIGIMLVAIFLFGYLSVSYISYLIAEATFPIE